MTGLVDVGELDILGITAATSGDRDREDRVIPEDDRADVGGLAHARVRAENIDVRAPHEGAADAVVTAPVVPDMSVEVDDVDAVYAVMRESGAEVVHPLQDEEWGVRRFFVRDPNGRVVNVLSHR